MHGIALGAVYALIALGFVIVYKATQVINFAQGELVLLGAYLVCAFNQTALPFAVSVALAVVVMAGVGWVIERTILRRMVGKPVFAVVMITIGLAIVIRQIVSAVWGFDDVLLGEPWAAERVQAGAPGAAPPPPRPLPTPRAPPRAVLFFFPSPPPGGRGRRAPLAHVTPPPARYAVRC